MHLVNDTAGFQKTGNPEFLPGKFREELMNLIEAISIKHSRNTHKISNIIDKNNVRRQLPRKIYRNSK